MELRNPEFEGQICTIVNTFADEDPNDVYIVTEDPSPFDDEDNIYVVSLNELQRNIGNPLNCQQIPVVKNDLKVIADNLQDYIASWNV